MPVLAQLNQADFELYRQFSFTPGFAGWATASGLAKLMQNPEVLLVYEDIPISAFLNESVPLINADDVHDLGYTGDGVTVAVLDTGIETDHPDLGDDLIAEYCFTQGACPPSNSNESAHADDGDGHGTAVAGVITSQGSIAPEGVAPDAEIVAVKVLDDNGSGILSDWVSGIEWVIANRATYNISIINISLGTTSLHSGTCDNVYPDAASAVNLAVANGITVFGASGNNASSTQTSAPACLTNVVSVGAVYDDNVGSVSWTVGGCTDTTTSADKICCFSNSNDQVDLLAPSYRNRTTGLNGGVKDAFGGTSAATPHVAASAALLLEADPGLTPQLIESLLEDTGVLITDSRNGITFPRVDVLAAIQEGNLTIHNLGTGGLTVFGINEVTGSCWLALNPPQPTPLTIPAGEGIIVDVLIDEGCVSIGSFSDIIRVTSDDPDESTVDVPVTLQVISPEIDVRGNGQSIADGDDTPSAFDHTDFGLAVINGGTVEHIFVIYNTGSADLTLNGSLIVEIGGAHANDFTLTEQPTSPVASSGCSTTFTVEFDPSAIGVRTATLSIANNDTDENPYNFTIQGTGAEYILFLPMISR